MVSTKIGEKLFTVLLGESKQQPKEIWEIRTKGHIYSWWVWKVFTIQKRLV